MKAFLLALCTAALLSAASVAPSAHAQTRAENSSSAPISWSETTRLSVERGSFLALTLTPSVGLGAAQAATFAGYDSASASPELQSFVEARVIGPLALRVGAELRDNGEELAPSIGARWQLLSQGRHGVMGAIAVFYKAEGFTEAEGELETVLSLGTRVGRTLLIGNLAYGQDPEGHERDGELRAAALYGLSDSLQLGLDARGRFDLGSERAKLRAANEPSYDLGVGPVLTVALGPVALGAHAGLSVLRYVDEKAQAGAIALGGLGTAF
jgi:hypothetical protein